MGMCQLIITQHTILVVPGGSRNRDAAHIFLIRSNPFVWKPVTIVIVSSGRVCGLRNNVVSHNTNNKVSCFIR